MADASNALDDAYRGVRTKEGKGAGHARAVAAILRAAGCSESVQVAGLLHDVVEDTPWTVEDVAVRFGRDVADLVSALTEDEGIGSYHRRKEALRDQIAAAGSPATDVAIADKIATLHHLRVSGRPLPKRKRAHYEATLATARETAQPTLARELADLLDALAVRHGRERTNRLDDRAQRP